MFVSVDRHSLAGVNVPMALTNANAIALVSLSMEPNVEEAKDKDSALDAQSPAAMMTNMT